ncbi:HD domain-containing protein [uncultured Clostridium sp.]|uniref:HD-GYP domain-containing protein n=1 Tax=uncultured Clostridium sp. TaxID=59620 RepID=UPI0028E25271|nr:HD domain-containing phosphohydrolase [uncultured Clostridium sp.]
MKLVVVKEELIGEVLANPIYTENGILFLNKGNKISQKLIMKLREIGVSTIYIEDGNDEITLQEILPTPIKLQIINSLKRIFQEIKEIKYIDYEKVMTIVNNIIENINLYENAVLISNLILDDEISKLAIHSLDVSIMTIIMGIKKKLKMKRLIRLGTAALLHDIGKLFTDNGQHTKIGKEIVKENILFSPTIYMAIYYLYEREDGSGPHGIKGDKLHEYVKILSICNEYINSINGEKALLPHEAIEKIIAQSTTKFDKEIFKEFINSIYCYPNGLQVKLNNGLFGVVVMQNKGATTRPVILINNDNSYSFCNLIDESNLTLFIERVIL